MKIKEVIEINARELAEKLGKHPNTIYKDIRNGKIKANRVGKSYEIDDSLAHSMIIRQIYDQSSNRTDQVINTLIEALEAEKRRSFGEFLMYIHPIAQDYMDAVNSLEDWELENMLDNPIIIDAEIKAIEEYERKIKEPFEKKSKNIRDRLEQYERTVSAIKVVKENKFFAECEELRKAQFSMYEEIKKKLNKEDITTKDIVENIKI